MSQVGQLTKFLGELWKPRREGSGAGRFGGLNARSRRRCEARKHAFLGQAELLVGKNTAAVEVCKLRDVANRRGGHSRLGFGSVRAGSHSLPRDSVIAPGALNPRSRAMRPTTPRTIDAPIARLSPQPTWEPASSLVFSLAALADVPTVIDGHCRAGGAGKKRSKRPYALPHEVLHSPIWSSGASRGITRRGLQARRRHRQPSFAPSVPLSRQRMALAVGWPRAVRRSPPPARALIAAGEAPGGEPAGDRRGDTGVQRGPIPATPLPSRSGSCSVRFCSARRPYTAAWRSATSVRYHRPASPASCTRATPTTTVTPCCRATDHGPTRAASYLVDGLAAVARFRTTPTRTTTVRA